MATHCYIGRNAKCGHIRAVVADDGDKETAKTVGEFIKQGAIIERMEVGEFRKVGFGSCEICNKRG